MVKILAAIHHWKLYLSYLECAYNSLGRCLPWEVDGAAPLVGGCTAQRSHTSKLIHYLAPLPLSPMGSGRSCTPGGGMYSTEESYK